MIVTVILNVGRIAVHRCTAYLKDSPLEGRRKVVTALKKKKMQLIYSRIIEFHVGTKTQSYRKV